MARAGRPGSIRGEAARQGVTEYQIRKQRAIAQGISPRAGVGKPGKGELSITAQRLAKKQAGGKLTAKEANRLLKLLERPARELGISLHEAWTRFVASPDRAPRAA